MRLRIPLALQLFPLIVAALLVLAAVSGCTTLGQVDDIPDMTEPEWIAWRTTLVEQIGTVAESAYAEGEVSGEDLDAAASIITVIGGSNTVEAGQLAEWLDLSGYKAALLKLTILELDSKLVAGGAYIDGLLGPRGKELLIFLGARLEEIHVSQ